MRRIGTIVSAVVLVAIAAHAGAYASVGSFTDQRGLRFALDDLRGHPTVLTFVSAHCTDACPLIEADIAAAAVHERAIHGRLRFFTVTLDPQRDSIGDIRHIASIYGADPSYWRVARGSLDRTRELLDTFGVVEARDRDGYETAHTTLVYVVNSAGRFVGSLLPSEHLTTQLASAEDL